MQTVLLPKGVCAKLERICKNFVWGATGDARKFHSIAWSQFCMPRNMRVKCPTNSSLTWKGICRTWRVVENGLRWRIGSGEHISFWTDRWLRSGNVLLESTSSVVPVVRLHDSIRDMSDGRGSWNLLGASPLIPQHNLQEISATLAAVDDSEADKPIWRWSQDGVFSTKSAYEAIIECLVPPGASDWNILWNWHGSYRIKHSLLMVIKGGLKTNALRLIWRARNEVIFQQKSWDVSQLGVQILTSAHEFLSEVHLGGNLPLIRSSSIQKLVGWTFPNDPWLKWNVDDLPGGVATCGGVLQNASGYWIRGFAHFRNYFHYSGKALGYSECY
ncbi:hypothetical protein SESBI_18410 [Sesbania bispinosa]|nr:hypothetical protein SESBI_18410 [Sesbania bispinosa]